jgi:hypothetical protein
MINIMIWIVVIAVWLIGMVVSYFEVFKKWDDEDANQFEKLWYSFVWPLIGILYGIHWLHNKL